MNLDLIVWLFWSLITIASILLLIGGFAGHKHLIKKWEQEDINRLNNIQESIKEIDNNTKD